MRPRAPTGVCFGKPYRPHLYKLHVTNDQHAWNICTSQGKCELCWLLLAPQNLRCYSLPGDRIGIILKWALCRAVPQFCKPPSHSALEAFDASKVAVATGLLDGRALKQISEFSRLSGDLTSRDLGTWTLWVAAVRSQTVGHSRFLRVFCGDVQEVVCGWPFSFIAPRRPFERNCTRKSAGSSAQATSKSHIRHEGI